MPAQLYNFCIQATANVACLHSEPWLAGPVLSLHEHWLFQLFLFINLSPAHAPSAPLTRCERVVCCGICVSAACAKVEQTSLLGRSSSKCLYTWIQKPGQTRVCPFKGPRVCVLCSPPTAGGTCQCHAVSGLPRAGMVTRRSACFNAA